MQLLRSIHDALERHVPSIDQESDRQEALAVEPQQVVLDQAESTDGRFGL